MDGYCMYCGTSLGTAGSSDGMCDRCRENSLKGIGTPVAGGWECPRCGKILAPWMPFCDCPPVAQVTYAGGTEDE